MPRIFWLALGACLLLVGCNPVDGAVGAAVCARVDHARTGRQPAAKPISRTIAVRISPRRPSPRSTPSPSRPTRTRSSRPPTYESVRSPVCPTTRRSSSRSSSQATSLSCSMDRFRPPATTGTSSRRSNQTRTHRSPRSAGSRPPARTACLGSDRLRWIARPCPRRWRNSARSPTRPRCISRSRASAERRSTSRLGSV